MLLHPATCQNLLLKSLPIEDFNFIAPHLERVPLNTDHVIAAPGEPITFVCFPECGVTSIVDRHGDDTEVEVAVIGREGMTNSQLLLGCVDAPMKAIVRIGGGSSLRLWAEALRELCRNSPSANALFLRFVRALAGQVEKTLISNLHGSLEQRLARWLLMLHDRVDEDEIRLKHEQIARMLGVRRATVTDTLHILEGERSIKCSRGVIRIRNRPMLEQAAAGSYGLPEQQYRQLICPFGKPLTYAGSASLEAAASHTSGRLPKGFYSDGIGASNQVDSPDGSLAPH